MFIQWELPSFRIAWLSCAKMKTSGEDAGENMVAATSAGRPS
jgi:hypothetical protein